MMQSLRHAARRPIYGLVLLCLGILLFALAACGGDSTSSSASTSSTANNSTAAMTVTIKESKAASGDVYTCDPTTLSVKKGDNVTFTNASDEVQDFSTAGDAQKAGVTLKLDINGSSMVTFNTAGTFMLESGKKAAISVTVQ